MIGPIEFGSDESSLRTAQLHAKHLVVNDEACRSVLEEHGANYDNMLTAFPHIAFIRSLFAEWIETLAATKVTEEAARNITFVLEVPGVEKMKEVYRQMIRSFTDTFVRP